MTTPKQTALTAINALPDDATWDAVDDAIAGAAPRFKPEQIAEWNRRIEDYRSGKVAGIPADEVHRELLAQLDSRRVTS